MIYDLLFKYFHLRIGWATDLKTVSDEMIRKRVARTGDGTHRNANSVVDENNNEKELNHCDLWGWGKWIKVDYAI